MADLLLDNDKYKELVALRTNLKLMPSPPALQDLCMDIYLSKASAIVSEWKESGENIFDSLPNNLRTDLLNYLMSRVHRKKTKHDQLIREQLKIHLYNLAYMLMHHQVVNLDFHIRYSNSASLEDFQEILTHVAKKCPKLEHFVASGGCERSDPRLVVMSHHTNGFNCLLQLVELRHLEINGLWYWTDDSLSKLFSHLKKLVVLKLLLHSSVSESGFQNIHLLKDLEEFHFAIDDPDIKFGDSYMGNFVSNYERIYNYCADNLRSLKLIGATADNCYGDLEPYSSNDLRRISPKIQGTSMLEYLHTNLMLPKADFPNLRHLFFVGPIHMNIETFHRKISNFTHLTELNVVDVLYKDIAKILQSVGTQLSSIYIDTADFLDLFQIFYFCPNLVYFAQANIELDEGIEVNHQSKYKALVTKHNVRLLQAFDAVFYEQESGGLLELVLFAPEMRHLSLSWLSISRSECKLIHEVLESSLNLVSFTLWYLDSHDSPFSMDDFGLFMECLMCSAPHLNRCYIFWENDFLSKKWDKQTVAQALLKIVNS